MSNERDLLKEIMSYFAKGDITIRKFENSSDVAETLHTAQELLAQPEHIPDIRNMVEIAPSSTKLQDRIKDYLSMGGLFNPELVNHDIVRDLILDARAELLTQKREPLSDGEITTNTPKTIPIGERLAFHAGIRWAEHQHGIRGV